MTWQVEAEDFANDLKDAHAMNRTANKLLQADEEARLEAIRRVREQENEGHAAAKGEAKAQRREELDKWQQDREQWQQGREEARAARAAAKEHRNQERQAALEERKQAILAQKAHEEGAQAVKGHERATKDANREYLRRLGEKDDEIRAYEKVCAQQAREEAKLEAAVAKAEAELAAVEESAKQAANKHFDTLDVRARRAADTYERRGLPVPEEVQTARDFVDDSYLENTPGRLSMPEVVRQNFIARERPAREAALKAAQEALANYRANKPDVEQQVRDLLGRKGTRVSKGEAYQLAQELGLNAGPLETFEPIPPKGGWQLTKPAPPEAPPAPDMTALKLKAIERQQAALQGQDTGPSAPAPRKPTAAPLPELARKPEAEILAEAGLDQPKPLTPRLELKADVDTRRPVAERVDEWINNAREPAMSEIRGKALTASLLEGWLPLPCRSRRPVERQRFSAACLVPGTRFGTCPGSIPGRASSRILRPLRRSTMTSTTTTRPPAAPTADDFGDEEQFAEVGYTPGASGGSEVDEAASLTLSMVGDAARLGPCCPS